MVLRALVSGGNLDPWDEPRAPAVSGPFEGKCEQSETVGLHVSIWRSGESKTFRASLSIAAFWWSSAAVLHVGIARIASAGCSAFPQRCQDRPSIGKGILETIGWVFCKGFLCRVLEPPAAPRRAFCFFRELLCSAFRTRPLALLSGLILKSRYLFDSRLTWFSIRASEALRQSRLH